jgi:2-succinyl-5-enolpyruvyl-6-hydroxy-3-cyclohexene-1-carboxylate synthase
VASLAKFLQEEIFEGLVVLLGGLEPEEREEAFHFLRDLGVPVLADPTSGLREVLGKMLLVDGDRLLRETPPGKILRLGDVPIGRFWRELEGLPDIKVCSVTRTGFSGLARESEVITGRVDDAIRGLGPVAAIGDVLDHLKLSAKREGALLELVARSPDSEPGLMRMLSSHATLAKSLFLGNSLPIREWSMVSRRGTPYGEVRANRGADGIDGQVSTWLGATIGQDDAWAVFGDLTVLYDLAAPALLGQTGGARRVLAVISNGGGRIFERLPRLRGLEVREAEVVANAHDTHFEEWARMWGMAYQRVESAEAFDFEAGEGTTVLEICPDARQTEEFWRDYESIG